MLLLNIFDSKGIHYQIKSYQYPFVPPYAGCVPTLLISMWCEIFGKKIVFYLSCLWEAVHSFSGIIIDMSNFLHSSKVVMFYFLLQYDVEWRTNISIPLHGEYEIKILDVEAYEARLWSCNITVE